MRYQLPSKNKSRLEQVQIGRNTVIVTGGPCMPEMLWNLCYFTVALKFHAFHIHVVGMIKIRQWTVKMFRLLR